MVKVCFSQLYKKAGWRKILPAAAAEVPAKDKATCLRWWPPAEAQPEGQTWVRSLAPALRALWPQESPQPLQANEVEMTVFCDCLQVK